VVSRENCHPFKCGRLLFCHNGRIDGFWGPLRKRILNDLTEKAYNTVRGTTDSEAAFGMILSELERSGQSLEQCEPYDPQTLVDAIRRTIDKLAEYQRIMDEKRLVPRENCRNFSTLNFSLTDGVTMVTSRFCDKQPEIPAPSLYFAFDYADRLRDGITRGAGLRPISEVGPGDGSGNVVEASSMSSSSSHVSFSGGASALSTATSSPPPPPLKKSEFEQIVADKMKRATSYQDNLDKFCHVHDKFKDMPPEDLDKMAFCVSSDPLTFCDMWSPIPGNSIMWYKVGGLPELIDLNNGENSHHSSISNGIQ
jgi:predicted glutamine amidotransferase